MITDVVYLSERLAGTVRFLTTVDVMLEEYNSCLPNNKWLGVKQVSIVLGWPLLLNRGFFLTYPENIVYDDILWIQRLYFLKFNLGGPRIQGQRPRKPKNLDWSRLKTLPSLEWKCLFSTAVREEYKLI